MGSNNSLVVSYPLMEVYGDRKSDVQKSHQVVYSYELVNPKKRENKCVCV